MRKLRALTVVDAFTREALAIDVEPGIKGEQVIETMSPITAKRGAPKTIRVDNGPEFISKALDLWAYANGVTLDFSRPGKPTDNAFIESFNGRLRDDPKSRAASVVTQAGSCLWTTLEARWRRGDETIMRSLLTYRWAD